MKNTALSQSPVCSSALSADMTALGFDVYHFENTVPQNNYRSDAPDKPLSLSRDIDASASISVDWFTADSFDMTQYKDFISFAESFGGETVDCYYDDPDSESFEPMYHREWRFSPESTDEITEMINKFLTLPYRTSYHNAHITFVFTANT